MAPLVVALDERLADAGDSYTLKGHLDEHELALSARTFALPDGIDYDVVLTNAGEGILATGVVRAHAVGTCDRCLEEARLDLSGEVDEYFLFHEPGPGEMDDDEDEADFALVSPDRTIDLSDAFLAGLVMDVPFVVLCRPDCKGLCPVCGQNLNEGDCGHAGQVERNRQAASPFAALGGIDFDAPDEDGVDDGDVGAAGGSAR